MMKKTFISSVCAAVAMLAGCGNTTPACADAETVSLVKQIYQQQFDKQHHDMSEERQQRVQFTVKDTTVALENITTDANNASTGKAVCSAQLTTVFPEDAVKADLRCQADRLSELGMPKLQSLNLGQDTRPLQLP